MRNLEPQINQQTATSACCKIDVKFTMNVRFRLYNTTLIDKSRVDSCMTSKT